MNTNKIKLKPIITIVLCLCIALPLCSSLPVKALTIEPMGAPFGGVPGLPVNLAFSVETNTTDFQNLKSIDFYIYNRNLPSTYETVLTDIPFTSSTSISYQSTQTGGGPADLSVVVSRSDDITFLEYELTWIPPVSWPGGSYGMAIRLYSYGGDNVLVDLQETIFLTLVEEPEIVCVWQTPDDGDPLNDQPGTQVLPTLQYGISKNISVFTVVRQGKPAAISQVAAKMFYPSQSPMNGSVKSEINLVPDDGQWGVQSLETAYKDGLVSFGSGEDYVKILNELKNGVVKLYTGNLLLDYDDPSGNYLVSTTIEDTSGRIGALDSILYFVPVNAFEIDFDHLDFGTIEIDIFKQIPGDLDFSTSGNPTIRNVGNTDITISYYQDDMGFGPDNVSYRVRLGSDGEIIDYAPSTTSVLPGSLGLSETKQLDFWIQVKKASSGSYSGVFNLTCDQVSP